MFEVEVEIVTKWVDDTLESIWTKKELNDFAKGFNGKINSWEKPVWTPLCDCGDYEGQETQVFRILLEDPAQEGEFKKKFHNKFLVRAYKVVE